MVAHCLNRWNVARDVTGRFNACRLLRVDWPLPYHCCYTPLLWDESSYWFSNFQCNSIQHASLLIGMTLSRVLNHTFPTINVFAVGYAEQQSTCFPHIYTLPARQVAIKEMQFIWKPVWLQAKSDCPQTSHEIMQAAPDGVFNYASAAFNDGIILLEECYSWRRWWANTQMLEIPALLFLC